MAEFAPIEGGAFNQDYRSWLLGQSVMPTALVRVDYLREDASTYPLLTFVDFDENEGVVTGLPTFDIAEGMDKGESLEHYVSFRLGRRYGLEVPEDQLRFDFLCSWRSVGGQDIAHREHPEVDSRIYFPVLGVTDGRAHPRRRNGQLVFMRSELVTDWLDDFEPGDDFAAQRLALHQEIMDFPPLPLDRLSED